MYSKIGGNKMIGILTGISLGIVIGFILCALLRANNEKDD
jgi:acid phosphatase family membrane protein YuiD